MNYFLLPAICFLIGCQPNIQEPGTADSSTSSLPATSSVASSANVPSSAAAVKSSVAPAPAQNSGSFDPLSEAKGRELAASVSIDVPFTPQAPFAEWTPELNEACEEASLVMVEYMLRGQGLSAQIALDEINALIAWETEHGMPWDIDANQVAQVAQELYGRKAKVYSGNEVTIENMKALLHAGYPIIIPAAGRQLGNPYFSGDGPPYHMLVLKGYKGTNFIAHDPGTRRGENYTYSQERILNVIHDWNGSTETISTGRKAFVVLGK